MSNTKYAHDRTLRMTAEEQHVLARAVMRSIETLSQPTSSDLTEPPLVCSNCIARREVELRTLRSLLERLSD